MSSPFFVVTLFHLGGQEKEKHWRWLAVRHFFRTRPSLRLSYSLPDLDLVKDRAPEVRPKSTKGLYKFSKLLMMGSLTSFREVFPMFPRCVFFCGYFRVFLHSSSLHDINLFSIRSGIYIDSCMNF